MSLWSCRLRILLSTSLLYIHLGRPRGVTRRNVTLCILWYVPPRFHKFYSNDNLMYVLLSCLINSAAFSRIQWSFWLWAQPMRDYFIKLRSSSLAEPITKMISGITLMNHFEAILGRPRLPVICLIMRVMLRISYIIWCELNNSLRVMVA